MITFTVHGVAQPQGSTRAFYVKSKGRSVVTTDNKKLKPWRQQVSDTAAAAMQEFGQKIVERPGAIKVHAVFTFQKPKSTPKSVIHKTTKPDIDKLLRGFLDALTGICFEDDSQVIECTSMKVFGQTPGLLAIIQRVESADSHVEVG